MGAFGGAAIRFTSTFFYAIEFCCAAIILGVYSYFLARLSENNLPISNDWKAIEGLSGAAVLYTIFAVLLTCFLGGVKFFAFLAITFDILFCGAFIAIAILGRDGAKSCSGSAVQSPLGSKNPNFGFPSGVNTNGYTPNLSLNCRINTAAFAVAIIGAVLMLISAAFQILIARHHQKEKRYGPGPSNGYEPSPTKRFWKRKPKTTQNAYTRDMEAPVVDTRQSHETRLTGTTEGGADTTSKLQNPYGNGYGENTMETSNYHTPPRGTAISANY